MKAFTVWNYAPAELFREDIAPPPSPRMGQVQLKLLGTSINPVDRLIAGGYGAPIFNPRNEFPIVLGRDAVASVVAVGAGVRDLDPGQRVLVASSPRTGGTYAEVFNLPRRCLAPIDDGLSDIVAAGIGYAGLTALQALMAVGISPGDASGVRLCINGASGGVGSMALLMASRWGAQVTAVASEWNHCWLKSLGARSVVDYRDPEALASISADIVIDCATPSMPREAADPLLGVVLASQARHRAYATTVTPLLTNVTEKGVIRGLTYSGAGYLKKSIRLRRDGVHYHWVMFKENPEQLEVVGRFFSQLDIPCIIGSRLGLEALRASFNAPALANTPGKAVFMAGFG